MKESRGRRRPRRSAGKNPARQESGKSAETRVAKGDGASAAPRRARFAWVAPLLLLAAVGTGIWYFVFRDDRSSQVDDLMRQAREAMATFEYGRAELLLRDAIAIAPGNGVLHHNLGITYVRQGRRAEARRSLETAASLYPPEANEVRAEEYWQLAQMDFQDGRWRDAELQLQRAITNHPTRELFHHRLIDLQLARLGKQGAADSSTMRFLQFCGGTAQNLRDGAEIHMTRSSYASAIALARQAIALQDTMVAAYYILARSHWRAGYLDEAVAVVEPQLQRFPNAVDLWVLHGSILVGLKRIDEALESIDHGLELKPDHYDGNVARMMALIVGARYDEAMLAANRSVALTQDENELRFLRGQQDRIRAEKAGISAPDSLSVDGAFSPEVHR